MHSSKRVGAIVLGSLLLVFGAGETMPSPRGTGNTRLVITNVTVIDGAESTPIADATIVIRGNRIERIAHEDSLGIPKGARVYNGGGGFVIPGLWDMHTHVLWDPFVADGFLELHIVNGVTGIRDMGGELDVVRDVRPGRRYDSPLNPRIVAAGPWLNEFIIDPRAGISIESVDAAREAVQTLAEAGVDFIKPYSFLERDIFLAILEEARMHGLPVAGHVPHKVSIEEASNLGMRSIEHLRVETGGLCANISEEECDSLLTLLRRNQTWQTPTLVVRRNGALLDHPGTDQYPGLDYAPSYLRREWDETRENRLSKESFDEVRVKRHAEFDLARTVCRAGLPILAGSDSGDMYSVPGFSIHEELALLVEAGLSPAQALRTATSGAASFLGLADSLGVVGEGKLADLVILEANPLTNIRHTTGIQAVVRDGRLFEREALDRILDDLSRKASQ